MLRSLESTTYRLCAALVLQRERRHRQVRQTAASPRAECACSRAEQVVRVVLRAAGMLGCTGMQGSIETTTCTALALRLRLRH